MWFAEKNLNQAIIDILRILLDKMIIVIIVIMRNDIQKQLFRV